MARKASGFSGQALTAATVRTVVRALEQIHAEIEAGAHFPITRMTRVKRLCADQAAAEAFARAIAGYALRNLERRTRPASVDAERGTHFVALAREGMRLLDEYLAVRSPAVTHALRAQQYALYQAQNKHQNIPYGAVRIIVCWEAMQVETAIACVLATVPEARARYGYDLAADYVKRYEPTVSGPLNRASSEALAEVIDFWRQYADHLVATDRPSGV